MSHLQIHKYYMHVYDFFIVFIHVLMLFTFLLCLHKNVEFINLSIQCQALAHHYGFMNMYYYVSNDTISTIWPTNAIQCIITRKFRSHKRLWNINHLESRLRSILGTGRSWLAVTACRSTGQVGWRLIHSVIQARQNACSQAGACANNF